MKNYDPHAPDVIVCRSIFAGPCMCGPAVHINLERERGKVTATIALTLHECEWLIQQIRTSMKLVAYAKKELPQA